MDEAVLALTGADTATLLVGVRDLAVVGLGVDEADKLVAPLVRVVAVAATAAAAVLLLIDAAEVSRPFTIEG